MIRNLASGITEFCTALVRTPETLLRLSLHAEELLKRLDQTLELIESIEAGAEEVVSVAKPIVEEARTINEQLESAMDKVESLGLRVQLIEELVVTLTEVEKRLAEVVDRLVSLMKIAQPIEDAQERAQKIRDSLRIRPKKGRPSE